MATLLLMSLQLSGCGAVVVGAAAATSCSLRLQPVHAPGGRGDAMFWNGFVGLVFLLPALLLAALVQPLAGGLLTALGLCAAVAGYRLAPALSRRRDARQRTAGAGASGIAEQHRALLAHWQRYELDPGLAIDYPLMQDVRQQETAALVRRMGTAGDRRTAEDPAAYRFSVDALERALAEAEAAAGVPAAARWSVHRVAPRQGRPAVPSSFNE